MNDRKERAEAIFDDAAAMPDAERREGFVRDACGSDDRFAEEILALLRAHDEAEGFLRTVTQGDVPGGAGSPDKGEGPGSVIGRYKLLQKIGEGGFGVVYMAEQEAPIRRRVALKVIKPGMDTRQVIARFEAERQALAMMEHPNIARVFDAGCTESGRPYFVMELVRGVGITEYCDRENLPTKERLLLFNDVCRAIQHAHLKGVIHRDIKPSNVMVTLHDGMPVPKVIDFGIAKATQQRLTEKTLFTQFRQFVGTPAYMSPEQAEMSGLDVDTRTDVYSLGVMLYELLVGAPPFDAAKLVAAGYDEMRRQIREVEPSKPSTRLATLAAPERTSVARRRGCGPGMLSRALQGDLDWIVLTALEKDRRRRYESPGLLAKDIDRYLDDQIVEARPPSFGYRIRKLVRRHRIAATAGAITAASLAAGFLFTLHGLDEARRGWGQAAANLATARQNARVALSEKQRADREAASVQRLLYPTMLTAASAAAANGRRHRAEELLAMCPSTARGWEWDWLSGVLVRPIQSFTGLSEDHCVQDARFDPTGIRVVAAGAGVSVLDVVTSARITSFHGHEGPVFQAAFMAGGMHACSIGGDETLRVYDLQTGVESNRFTASGDRFTSATMTDDGERIVTGETSGAIRLWSRGAAEELALMGDRVPELQKAAVSPDRKRIAAVSRSGRLFVWAEDGTRLFTAAEPGLGLETVAFSPVGGLIATGDQEGRVVLWNPETGIRLNSWIGHSRAVSAIDFGPDGSMIASGGWEGGVSVRDVASSAELGFFVTADAHIHALTFAPDGNSILVAGERGTMTRWSFDQSRPVTTFVGHGELVFETVMSPDGGHLASVSRDGTARVWDAVTGAELTRLRWRAGSVYSLDVNADGTRLATRGSDGTVRLWDLPAGRLLREQAVDYRVRNLRFGPDGSRLAAGASRSGARPSTADPAVAVFDVATGMEIIRLEGHHGEVMRMDFDPTGTRLVTTAHHNAATGREDGRALVWDLATGEILQTLLPEGGEASNSVIWSPDGARIYTGHSDGRVCFWDANSGTLDRTVYAHGEMVGAIELSRDGTRLLTSAWYSPAVKLWHPETGELQFSLDTGIPGISDAGFDPENRGIIVAGMDGGLKRFEVGHHQPGLFQIRRRIARSAEAAGAAERALFRHDLEGDAFQAAMERFIAARQSLDRIIGQAQPAAKATLQVASTALDQAAESGFRNRRFDQALQALNRAQSLLPSPDRVEAIQWVRSARAVIEGTRQSPAIDLARYVGTFEERHFFLRDGQLIYRHLDFENEWPLLPIGPDRFLVSGDETTQLVFVTGGPGEEPAAVEGHYFAGGHDLSFRTELHRDLIHR